MFKFFINLYFLLIFFSSQTFSAVITRGPYLQSMTPTSIIIRWRTDVSEIGKVNFGTINSNLSQSATDQNSKKDHEVKISNLKPETIYFYNLEGNNSEINSFKTFPNVGDVKSARIWVLGDSGTADANQRAVRDSFNNLSSKEKKQADLWLMLGDNAYNNGTDFEYQAAVFDIYKDMLKKSPLFSTRGNHDNNSGNAYLDIFSLPNTSLGIPKDWTDGQTSASELYYSFNYGEIHFICLDSESSQVSSKEGGGNDSPMITWLRNDLANTKSQWIIAFWHQPPYSKGSHDSDTTDTMINMRKHVLPILESGGVDLILSGHSHSYERSYLIDGHYGFSSKISASNFIDKNSGRESEGQAYTKKNGLNSHEGTIYTVAGSSGKIEQGGPLNHPAMFISLLKLGSLVIDVNHGKLDVRFLRESGAIDDNFTIVKDSNFNTKPPVVNPPVVTPPVVKPPVVNPPVVTPPGSKIQPDLQIVDAYLVDRNIFINIINKSSQKITSTNMKLKFQIQGHAEHFINFNSINANETKLLQAEKPMSFLDKEIKKIKIIIDPDNVIKESNEKNNSYEAPIKQKEMIIETTPAKPPVTPTVQKNSDLIITSVERNNLDIIFYIKNQGSESTPNDQKINLTYRVDGHSFHNFYFGPVGANQTLKLVTEKPMSYLHNGEKAIIVQIDPENKLPNEINSNNTFKGVIIGQ